MGGMKVSDLDFLRLLPAFMRDDEAAIALSKAMNKLISEPGGRIPSIRTWDEIDRMSEAELDELAWELDVDWYDSTGMSLEEKRETLKLAQQIKRKRGTKWAVESLVSGCFGGGDVLEWFEYGGKPYCFKIITKADMNPENIKQFESMIAKVKNTRSYLEGMEFGRESRQCLYFCGVCITESQVYIGSED